MWLIKLFIEIFLWVVLFTFLLNQYERLNDPEEKESFDFMILLSYFWEIIVDIVIWFLYIFGFHNLDTKVIEDDKKFPIVMIPGYTMNRGYLYPYGKGLQNKGYNVYFFSPKKIFTSIEDIAKDLEEKINSVMNETGKDKVILIGHSMGGLLARYYVQRLSGEEHVEKIITVATPHFGTKLAPFGFGKNAREMEVNSDFIKELNRDIEPYVEKIGFLAIVSKADNMVLPYKSGILKGADLYMVDNLGHNALMLSFEIFGKILNEIEKTEYQSANE